MRPVVLSGFMGTGKSTLGPALAARLGVPFVDTDAEIERRSGRSVPDLWREEGEAAFRQREAELADRLLGQQGGVVVAFGGGTVTVDRVRRLAADRALVVTLMAAPEAVVARTPNLAARPNLAVGDPIARARELMDHRAAAYAECHLSLRTDTLSPEGALDAIVALVGRDPLLMPLGARSYPLDVCIDEPARLTDAVARCAPSSVVMVTDSNVQRARGAAIDAALRPLQTPTTRVALPAGETHKTLASVSTIWDAALGAGVDRDAVVVATGGGVVGDLAGFAAACLLRGVRFVQVPTTLLAMVDSSVGGKTGFDHPTGKNLVGAFHQPSAVVADLHHLTTLAPRELKSGLAEVAKIALATDAALLDRVEAAAGELAGGNHGALLPVVRAAIEAKIRIVRDDERESGPRALLNLGHTLGHALEAQGGYSRWLHGEAVAMGTVAEMQATASLGWTPRDLVHRAVAALAALGLPTRVDPTELAAAWHFVSSDKKRAREHTRDVLRLPVVTGPGRSAIYTIALGDLRAAALGS